MTDQNADDRNTGDRETATLPGAASFTTPDPTAAEARLAMIEARLDAVEARSAAPAAHAAAQPARDAAAAAFSRADATLRRWFDARPALSVLGAVAAGAVLFAIVD